MRRVQQQFNGNQRLGIIAFLLWAAAIIFPCPTLNAVDLDVEGSVSVGEHLEESNYHPLNNTNTSNVSQDSVPLRYDGVQLWRVYTKAKLPNSNSSLKAQKHDYRELSSNLESLFGANVWKEDPFFIDVSLAKTQLEATRKYLESRKLPSKLLHENIQDLIDYEGATSHPTSHKRQSEYEESSISISIFPI